MQEPTEDDINAAREKCRAALSFDCNSPLAADTPVLNIEIYVDNCARDVLVSDIATSFYNVVHTNNQIHVIAKQEKEVCTMSHEIKLKLL